MTLDAVTKPEDARSEIASLKEILRTNQDDSEAWRGIGYWSLRLGKNTDAISAYKRALAIDQDDYDAWMGLGTALFSLGKDGTALLFLKRFRSACDAYSVAISKAPDSAEPYYCKGLVLFLIGDTEMQYGNARRSTDSYLEAIDTFESAPGRDSDVRIMRCMGHVRTAIGRHEGTQGNIPYALEMCEAAIKAYERALGMDPDDWDAWYYHAKALLLAGGLEAKQDNTQRSRAMYYRAIASYKRAIGINKNDSEAMRGIKDANRLLRNAQRSEYDDIEDEEPEDEEYGAGGETSMRPY